VCDFPILLVLSANPELVNLHELMTSSGNVSDKIENMVNGEGRW